MRDLPFLEGRAGSMTATVTLGDLFDLVQAYEAPPQQAEPAAWVVVDIDDDGIQWHDKPIPAGTYALIPQTPETRGR